MLPASDMKSDLTLSSRDTTNVIGFQGSFDKMDVFQQRITIFFTGNVLYYPLTQSAPRSHTLV